MKLKNCLSIAFLILLATVLKAQKAELVPTPPMGFMTWNYFGLNITEEAVKTTTDAMIESGLKALGFEYIFIDDGWQGGRDNKNNMIPDPNKFPSGMKDLVDYVHSKGMKIGIYSDAAKLTCGGYTASLGFEEQDAKTFADWGFDYLKYDYCGAPSDRKVAMERYEKMAKALQNSGKDIVLGICEWGDRSPWLWGDKVGGHLWRTTADIRDKWTCGKKVDKPSDLHAYGAGIFDVLELNAVLDAYAGVSRWNDPDMLVVGLYGEQGAPSTELGGEGCTDTEYQTQMSLWCMMSAPLMISCDVRNMNAITKRILSNKDIIAVDQDSLGVQAKRIFKDDVWQFFVKPLVNGNVALAILNVSNKEQTRDLNLSDYGVIDKNKGFDVWSKESFRVKGKMKVKVDSHETKVFIFSK